MNLPVAPLLMLLAISCQLLSDPARAEDPTADDGLLELIVPTLTIAARRHVSPAFELFSNPSDDRLLSYRSRDGQRLTWRGKRSGLGDTVAALTLLDVVEADGRAYQILLDDYGMPRSIRDDTGLVVTLDLSGERSTPAAPSNGIDALGVSSLPIAYETVVYDGVHAAVSIPLAHGGSYQMSTPLALSGAVTVQRDTALAEFNATEPAGTLQVNVSKCGVAAYAPGGVTVNYRHPTGDERLKRFVRAEKTGQTGRYLAQIPLRQSNPAAPEFLQAICSTTATQLSRFCHALDAVNTGADTTAMCLQLGATLGVAIDAATPVLPVDGLVWGPSATGLCNTLFKVGGVACDTVGFGPGDAAINPDDMPSVLGVFCETNLLDAVDFAAGLDRYTIQAVADFRDGSPEFLASDLVDRDGLGVSDPVTRSSTGPLGGINVDYVKPTIEQVTVMPAEPTTDVGYRVSVDVACAPSGTDLFIAVGDVDDNLVASLGPSGLTGNATVTLDVPGMDVLADTDYVFHHVYTKLLTASGYEVPNVKSIALKVGESELSRYNYFVSSWTMTYNREDGRQGLLSVDFRGPVDISGRSFSHDAERSYTGTTAGEPYTHVTQTELTGSFSTDHSRLETLRIREYQERRFADRVEHWNTTTVSAVDLPLIPRGWTSDPLWGIDGTGLCDHITDFDVDIRDRSPLSATGLDCDKRIAILWELDIVD
jgi:hypothetical protein